MRDHFITCLQIIKVNDFYLKIRIGEFEYFAPADEFYLALLAVLISGQTANVELLASTTTKKQRHEPKNSLKSVVEEDQE